MSRRTINMGRCADLSYGARPREAVQLSENNIIVDMTTRIFQDLCDPQTVNNTDNNAWKEPFGPHWKRPA